jgi:hypothetical protein
VVAVGKKVGIMQPYFFPCIGYWQLINAVDRYVIFDDVNFIKGGWISRNKILINGAGHLINLPLHKASQNKLINEIEIINDAYTVGKILKKIESAYKKAPYYNEAFPVLEKIITQDEKNLAKYLEYLIKEICQYLSIETKIFVSSRIKKKQGLKGQDRIIEICKTLQAKLYINAIGGKDLYHHEEFNHHGIKLRFLKTGDISYHQANHIFVPNLSIIDVMMFNERNETQEMLNKYELID